MIRVVLDTNVVVSALLNPFGTPAKVLSLALLGVEAQLCISSPVFSEYETVLARPRLDFDPPDVKELLQAVLRESFWVESISVAGACSDPEDNMFLDCAHAAKAPYLVTGNTRHFPIKWAETQIISPRGFIDKLDIPRLQ